MAKAEKPRPAAKPKPSKKTQYGRFVEAARKLGCDESEDTHELPAPHVIAADWGSSGRRIRSRAANVKVE
jgi:hypothetical protein